MYEQLNIVHGLSLSNARYLSVPLLHLPSTATWKQDCGLNFLAQSYNFSAPLVSQQPSVACHVKALSLVSNSC